MKLELQGLQRYKGYKVGERGRDPLANVTL